MFYHQIVCNILLLLIFNLHWNGFCDISRDLSKKDEIRLVSNTAPKQCGFSVR